MVNKQKNLALGAQEKENSIVGDETGVVVIIPIPPRSPIVQLG